MSQCRTRDCTSHGTVQPMQRPLPFESHFKRRCALNVPQVTEGFDQDFLIYLFVSPSQERHNASGCEQ
eukprot:1469832-Rhodomonas_salina.3